jgi:hypothetical protein
MRRTAIPTFFPSPAFLSSMASSADATLPERGLPPLLPLTQLVPPDAIARFVIIDESQRVVRVCLPNTTDPDMTTAAARLLSDYVFRLFDVDDIALVLHNATRCVDPANGWSWPYLRTRLAPYMHHKFKRFEAVVDAAGALTGEFTEGSFIALLFEDFERYLTAASTLRAWDFEQLGSSGLAAAQAPPAEFSRTAVLFPPGLLADADPSAASSVSMAPGTAAGPLADSSQPLPQSARQGPPLFLEVHDEKVRSCRLHRREGCCPPTSPPLPLHLPSIFTGRRAPHPPPTNGLVLPRPRPSGTAPRAR